MFHIYPLMNRRCIATKQRLRAIHIVAFPVNPATRYVRSMTAMARIAITLEICKKK
jgi:hypothetical protein